MDINQIRMAIAVADHKSFSKVAKMMSYSQPTVSKQVDSLEKELGLRIFERKARSSVTLTEAGESLYPYLEAAFDALSGLQAEASKLCQEDLCILSVGYPHGISTLGEDEILLRFNAKYPTIAVDQTAATIKVLIDMLKRGDLDGAFIVTVDDDEFPELNDPGLDYRKIRDLRLKIAMAEHHPALKRESLSLRDLEHETFLFRSFNNHMENDRKIQYFKAACHSDGFEPMLKFEEARGSFLFSLVASGQCVAPLMYRPKTTRSDIKVVSLAKDYYRFTLRFYFKKGNHSQPLRKFLDFIDKAIK